MIIFGGTGFIGSEYNKMFPGYMSGNLVMHRDENTIPYADNVLYLISTVDNYNVFTNPTLDVETNLLKLMQILPNVARKLKGTTYVFNFVSSWFVYGKETLCNEDTGCEPRGLYSITKKCAEDLVISYCKTHQINYRIFRLCNVYGVNDKKASAKKNALNFLLKRIGFHEPISLYNDGYFYRDYMHVTDVCQAINLLATTSNPNQIYNIANGYSYEFRRIIENAIQIANSTSVISSMEPTEFHKLVQSTNCFLDATKLKSHGFEPKYDVLRDPFE